MGGLFPASQVVALSSISKLTDSALILEDKSASSGFPKTGLYIRGVTNNIGNQFYIGFPPTTSYTTASTPPVLLTGQEKDKKLLVFSLNGQEMTSFSSGFDLKNNSANKLFINSRGTPVMTVTGKGYIGIGTTSPAGFFHVAGNMYVDGIVRARAYTSDRSASGNQLAAQFAKSPTGIFASVGTINGTSYKDYSNSVANAGRTSVSFNVSFAASETKNFVIPHPNDKQRYLVHATLEGPENGVRYRGQVRLKKGKAQISLPDYVSEFTDPETATIHLSADRTGESLRVIYTQKKWLHKGGNIAIESENADSDEIVSWTVQITRADIRPLQITPAKNRVHIDGVGPYKTVKRNLP